jgi:predicted DNA-binding ribbon-helix-helix protein
MIKKSVSIAGHRTSIALEKEFWESLDEILLKKNLSFSNFLIEIDEARTTGLASAIRVYILNEYKKEKK